MFVDTPKSQGLELEISQLEARLHDLRSQLDVTTYPSPPSSHTDTKTQWTIPSGELVLYLCIKKNLILTINQRPI